MRQNLTVVTTNDFFCSAQPWETSWGYLPGADGLRSAVESFRRRGPTLWVDAGDFAQGGPIATYTEGWGGFDLAGELGIDVAAAGNHEFDWGVEHLESAASRVKFPILCANHLVRLPGSAVIDTAWGLVGVVGLTHPHVAEMVVPDVPPSLPGTREIFAAEVRALRRQGAELVVAVVHDGVEHTVGSWWSQEVPPGAWWAHLASEADVVVCGHTLQRFVGRIGNVPVLQPWPFGAELGIAEFGQDRQPARVGAVRPPRGGNWSGAGRQWLTWGEPVGIVRRPARNAPGIDISLAHLLADAACQAAGADLGLVPLLALSTHQPPIDGNLAWLPAGPVDEAWIARLVPWKHDDLWAARIPSDQVGPVTAIAQQPFGECGIAGRGASSTKVRVVASRPLATALADQLATDFEPTGVSMRSALNQYFQLR